MRKSKMIKWTGALAAVGLAGGMAASQANAMLIIEVKAVSTDNGTVSADGKSVSITNGQPANIQFQVLVHHTLDAGGNDPMQNGLGSWGITVNSQNDTLNGVPFIPATPSVAVGNVTASLLHGGPNDPDAPVNGGSGFGLNARFNQFDSSFGDGTLASAEKQVNPADGDIDLVLMNAAQNISASPGRFLPFYGASKTVGTTVDTLIGTFTFTTNNLAAGSESTQLGIYLPNTTGTFNATTIRSLTGTSTALGGGGAALGPLFITSANLGAPVTVSVTNGVIPEPASIGLLGLGAMALVRRRRK